MQIVDAQIHIWGSGLPMNDAHWPVTSFTAAEAVAMMDEAGVDAAVIHPPGWDLDGHTVAARAVRDYPGRFAVMGALELDDPDTPARLATWREDPGMLGLRYLFRGEDAKRLSDGSLDWLWSGAEEAGIAIAMLATGSEPAIARIAERHPGLKLTIDHLGGLGGFETRKDHAAMPHMPDLLALARHPNIAVKATGLPGYSGEDHPFPIMQDYLRQVFEAFGPERTFWGTDISKMPCSWTECITMFTELPWLSEADKHLVMGDAICAWWGWDRG